MHIPRGLSCTVGVVSCAVKPRTRGLQSPTAFHMSMSIGKVSHVAPHVAQWKADSIPVRVLEDRYTEFRGKGGCHERQSRSSNRTLLVQRPILGGLPRAMKHT